MSNFFPLEVVCRGNETQLQVSRNLNYALNSALDIAVSYLFEQGCHQLCPGAKGGGQGKSRISILSVCLHRWQNNMCLIAMSETEEN